MSNGKGSSPRNNSSKQFFIHYDEIDWDGHKDTRECQVCGATIKDWKDPKHQLKNAAGKTIYICSKGKH